ncbi:anion-transporting ATPase-like domain containing protein [Nitzschia inconspicua]|uniref:Anion-transporting ATPase-like domain containing protein n=1 Tax=Nitzschia inconspicua TaxID=303405 RepID=A0A9K3LEX2_9STRA|nr:anion-transporting ATPase-like domain containing protein [Nitzschia inconspicua]
MRLTINEGSHRPLSALTKPPTQSTCPVAYHHHPRRQGSHLYSLRHLVEEVSNQPTRQKGPRTIFVGGKGGVGKTTVSSALAVKLASGENDLKVLVVSTDPAHSLGDALDEDLRRGRGNPVVMTDPITNGRLQACEVDASAALEEFRRNLEAFDIMKLADALGVSPDLLQGFGLAEFSGLLNNPPPGLDELVALSNVLDSNSVASEFDVVVVDTAPTGHTLRLLALPQFLDGLLGKLIKLRMKLSGLASTLQALFGNSQADQRARAIDNAVDRLETFRTKMSGLRSRLQDSSSTSFVVVTIPTKLSVSESKRLISELSSQGVSVTDVVVNQCVTDFDSEEAVNSYYQRRKAGQDVWVNNLKDAIDKVSASSEFRENGSDSPIALTKVPFFDVELVGVPALYYLGSQCFVNNPNFSHLMEEGRADDCKVLICGGKGGVGKTTTSSSLAVSMAAKGHNVALISTDPAHSLGDAIDMNLAGGNLVDCPLVGVPPSTGSLSVLEVDPSQSINQFKGVVDKLIGGGDDESSSGVRNTLKELEEVFDTLPAGTDEVVALAKVINLVKKGGYDRIVIDTAPTGHTLRMLSTPGFLAELIDRLLAIADKVNSNAAVKLLVAGSAKSEELETAAITAKSTLLSFQMQMYDLEDLFSDPYQTEFIIVTVPTELAVRESTRLLNDLTFEAPDMPIKVRNVVVNQVLKDDGSDAQTFLSHVHDGQMTSIEELRSSTCHMSSPPCVTTVPYIDTEPRGVFGLKILADELLRE